MKTRCLIVDDEPLAIQLLEAHIAQVSMLEVVGTANNALEALEALKTVQIDLVFLDIQMPMLTGVEFLKSLAQPPKVIFTTAYREYAMEGYELNIVDYLLKPITFERFFKAINKYLDSRTPTPSQAVETPQAIKEADSGHLFINVNKKHIKVAFQDILYIESLKDYIKIHLPGQSLMTKEKISEFNQSLPDHFLRVHRSFIVNAKKVTAFTAQDVEIGDIEIPIGVSYKQAVLEGLKPR